MKIVVIIIEEHPIFTAEVHQALSKPDDFGLLNCVSTKDAAHNTASIPLTPKESQILNYIADGNSNKQIAYILQLSVQTVKNHVSTILHKLNANDRAHAVALAMGNGWISAK